MHLLHDGKYVGVRLDAQPFLTAKKSLAYDFIMDDGTKDYYEALLEVSLEWGGQNEHEGIRRIHRGCAKKSGKRPVE